MHRSIFDGNCAADGAAVNLAYYSAKFTNVTFSNSIESTIRVSLYCTYRISRNIGSDLIW